MATIEQVGVTVRDITGEEAEHFQEHGWVLLRELIPREDALDLLARAKARMGGDGLADWDPAKTLGSKTDFFRSYYKIDEEDERFRSLRVHRTMGRNAAKLYGREMAIRSITTLVAPKLPSDLEGQLLGTGLTDAHQDGNLPGNMNTIGFWLALDHATPEMGTMRFRERSHRLGLLTPPVSDWPQVESLPLSPPLTLEPGDATAHHQLTIHGAPQNLTDKVRWAFIWSYFPAHAKYNGQPSHHVEGLGLQPGDIFDVPQFPLVYDPAAE